MVRMHICKKAGGNDAGKPTGNASVNYLASIVESSNDAIIGKSTSGRITSWNAGAERIYGYSKKDAIGKNITFITPPEKRNELKLMMKKIRCGESIKHFETRRITKNGRIVEVSLTISPILDSTGKVIGASTIARDITEKNAAQKEMARNEERYASLFRLFEKSSMDVSEVIRFAVEECIKLTGSKLGFIGFISHDGKKMYAHLWSEKAMERCEIRDKPLEFSISHAGMWAESIRKRKPFIINDYSKNHPAKKGHPKGHVEIKRFFSIPVIDCGKVAAVIALANKSEPYDEKDVNQLSLFAGGLWEIIRRKKSEESLASERQRLSYILEGTNVGTWEWNIQTGETSFNERWAEIIGYKLKEISPVSIKTWERFAHPDDLKKSDELLEKHFRGELDHYEFEARMRHKNGEWVWVQDRGKVVAWTKKGKPLLMCGTHLDVTARKKIEMALYESEDYLNTLLNSIHTGVVVIEYSTHKIVDINPHALSILRMKKEDVVGNICHKFICPTEIGKCPITDLGMKMHMAECILIRSDGFRVPILKSAVTVERKGKRYLIESFIEITDRKNAEQKLKDSEEKYRALAEASPEMIYVVDAKGIIKYLNEKAAQQLNLKSSKAIGKNISQIFAPEFAKSHLYAIENVLKSRKPFKREMLEKFPIGEMWIEVSLSPIIDSSGTATAVLGISNDITERKKTEEMLKRSEEKYRSLTERMSDVLWTMDMDLNTTYVSPSIERMLGFTVEERIRQNIQEQLTPQSLATAQEILAAEIQRDGEPGADPNRAISMELEYYHKNGSLIWAENTITAVRNQNGEIIALQGISRDISERKKWEQKLRESEEKYRNIFHNAIEGIYQSTPEGKYISVNPAFAQMLGYGRPDELKETVTDIAGQIYENPEDRSRIKNLLEHDGTIKNFETKLRRKDGKEIWVSINSTAVKGENGETAYYEGTMTDITERKLAENAIIESEERYRTLSETSIFPILLLDLQGNIIYCNQAAAKAAGHERPEELVGRSAISFVAPDDQQRLLDAFGNLTRTGIGRKKVEYLLMRHDGSTFPAEISSSAVNDAYGKISGVIAIIDDITERKKAEEDLRESQRRLSDIINFLPDATFAIDINGKIIAWNRAIESLTGRKASEMIGRGDYEYAIPFYGKRRPILIDLALQPNKDIESMYSSLKRYGNNIIAETYVSEYRPGGIYLWGASTILYDSRGNVAGAIESIRDITERKMSEQVLMDALEKRQEMETIVNKSPIIVFKWRAENGLPVEYVSENIKQFGYSAMEITNKKMTSSGLVDLADIEKVTRAISESAKNGDTSFSHECWIKTKSGERRYVECRIWIRPPSGEEAMKYHGIVMDTTEKKRAEEAQAQVEAIRRLDEIKTRFISVATHELRTPLVSIKGYSDLVLSGRAGDISSKVKELLLVASRNTDRLIHLTDDLLDVQRIETGRLKIDMREIDLRDILTHCVSEIKPIVELKKQKFTAIMPEKNMKVMGDGPRLEQVFMNVLNNASKFTQYGGKISLGMACNEKWIDIRISDNGIGIKKEDIQRIFEPFADIKKETYVKGTGLGLSVAKGITEAHGGKIIAESPGEGKGSTFTIRIPAISCNSKNGENNG